MENQNSTCPVGKIGKFIIPALLIAAGLTLLGVFISQGFGKYLPTSVWYPYAAFARESIRPTK